MAIDPIENLGPALKEIRVRSGQSLREVARLLEVSPSFLSQIENGKSQPSVATLYSLSKLLDVPVDQLFSGKIAGGSQAAVSDVADAIDRSLLAHPADAWRESGSRISLINPHNRSSIVMDSGVRWERLAATQEAGTNFMEIVYEPGAESNANGELIQHEGYEYGYALEGELEVTVGEGVFSLSKSQSIGFDSGIPHKFKNNGHVPFRGIWFVHGRPSTTSNSDSDSSTISAKKSVRKSNKSI